MDLSFRGTISRIGEIKSLRTKENTEFYLREVVLEESNAQYPNSLVVELTGDNAQYFNGVPGQTCEVFYNSRARENNGRWFNSLRAWRYTLN